MVKFFDINDTKSGKETPPSKSAEEPKAEAASKAEPIQIEPAAAIADDQSDAPKKETETKPEKTEKASEPEEHAASEEDGAPKAPIIPRATAAMAPKEKERVAQTPSPNLIHASVGRKQKIVTAILSTILIVLLALLVSQAVIFFTQNKSQTTITPKVDDTPKVETKSDTSADSTKTTSPATSVTTPDTTSSAATTTTSTALTKEKATLRVLNGGGVTGAATKVTTALKAAGYTVTSTANAKSYSYATTLVLYKNADGKTVAEDIAATLSTYTTEVKEDATTVGTASDILVIVGKK